MKHLLAILITASSLFALDGTGSYELKMSDKQSVINLYSKKAGYINVRMIPHCGTMELLDHNNKRVITGSGYAPINWAIKQGTYKLIVIPSQNDCTINILMPE